MRKLSLNTYTKLEAPLKELRILKKHRNSEVKAIESNVNV